MITIEKHGPQVGEVWERLGCSPTMTPIISVTKYEVCWIEAETHLDCSIKKLTHLIRASDGADVSDHMYEYLMPGEAGVYWDTGEVWTGEYWEDFASGVFDWSAAWNTRRRAIGAQSVPIPDVRVLGNWWDGLDGWRDSNRCVVGVSDGTFYLRDNIDHECVSIPEWTMLALSQAVVDAHEQHNAVWQCDHCGAVKHKGEKGGAGVNERDSKWYCSGCMDAMGIGDGTDRSDAHHARYCACGSKTPGKCTCGGWDAAMAEDMDAIMAGAESEAVEPISRKPDAQPIANQGYYVSEDAPRFAKCGELFLTYSGIVKGAEFDYAHHKHWPLLPLPELPDGARLATAEDREGKKPGKLWVVYEGEWRLGGATDTWHTQLVYAVPIDKPDSDKERYPVKLDRFGNLFCPCNGISADATPGMGDGEGRTLMHFEYNGYSWPTVVPAWRTFPGKIEAVFERLEGGE